MAGPPSPAFSQLTVRYTGAALPFPAATTHGFTTSTEPLGDVLAAIETFGQEIVASLSSEVRVVDVVWKVGPVETGPSVIVPVGFNGSILGAASPPNTAYLVNLPVVGLSGRYAGRFYLPGPTDGDVGDGGAITPGRQAAVLAAVESAYDAVAAVGMEPRVFSTVSSDPRTVASLIVSGRVATQRRRLRR